MKLHRIFRGGTYGFRPVAGRGEAPVFTLLGDDPAAIEAALSGMYVEPSLRLDDDGELAYCVALPDRDPMPITIRIARADLPRAAAGAAAAGCLTEVRCPDRVFDLSDASRGLEQDWSGRVARALAFFRAGELEPATSLLHEVSREHPKSIPAAHHLLGRCCRAQNRLLEAIAHYLHAVRAATDQDGELLPYAAGPLSDMGVAFKKVGEVGKALHCFMSSLHLRPNHPEALLTFFSLFPTDEKLVLYGAARVLAIGGRDDLVGHYLLNYASASERDLAVLLALARQMSLDLNLLSWPFSSAQLGRLDVFERGLYGRGNESTPPATGALN
jgi:tetratricopeptide (TPR) repeat protein